MPNVLETLLMTRNIDPHRAMNLLQEHGIVSDECIHASDVATSDCWRAVEWIRALPKGILAEMKRTDP
jgi:hypothetical protein